MKVKELTGWLAGHNPEAEVDIEASVFPDEHGGYLDIRPIEELSEDGPDDPSLMIDVYLYDEPVAVRAARREAKSGEQRLVDEYVRHLSRARQYHLQLSEDLARLGADIDVRADLNGLCSQWASAVSLLAAQLGIESRLLKILRADVQEEPEQ